MKDPALAAILEAMEKQGKTRADLARLLGLDSSQVTRTFAGARRLQVHEMRSIEQWLGWAPSSTPVSSGQVVPLPGMVPLYGLVGASPADRRTFAEQNILGYVPMHPAQANVRDAFALQVDDVSMSPRYEPGEVVYLAPNRWPSPGKDGVVVTHDGYGQLKRFVKRTVDQVIMHQLNPDDDLTFELENIQAVHAVVGRG